MSSIETYNPPSVQTATSTGPAATVTQPSTTVAAVSTQMSRGPGDKEATLNRSTLGPRASTAAEGDPPTRTDDTCSIDDGTAVDPTSRTDSTTERVTTDNASDTLSLPSTTVDDPAMTFSTSSRTDALTTPPAPDTRLDGRTTPEKTTVVTKEEHNSERTGPTRNSMW